MFYRKFIIKQKKQIKSEHFSNKNFPKVHAFQVAVFIMIKTKKSINEY